MKTIEELRDAWLAADAAADAATDAATVVNLAEQHKHKAYDAYMTAKRKLNNEDT